jgi:hypothetical protein
MFLLRTGIDIVLYGAILEPNPSFSLEDKGELIEYRWMKPEAAETLSCSDDFNNQQMSEFDKLQLHLPKYGTPAVTSRQFPA